MTARGLSIVILVVLVAALGGLSWWRCESVAPELTVPERVLLGREGGAFAIEARDGGSGLRSLRATLDRDGGEVELAARFHEGKFLSGSGVASSELRIELDPEGLGLAEGEAYVDVVATDWSWRRRLSGNETRARIPLVIDLTPPRVYIESGLTYVRRGGAAAVVYSIDEAAESDGVEVGDQLFRGFPFPEDSLGETSGERDKGRRFALFAIPRDAVEHPKVRVIARDAAGNASVATFPARVQERSFEEVRIDLPASFLSAKVKELADHLGIPAEDRIAAFQRINTETRAANEARIAELIAASSVDRHWRGAFRQMRNSAVTSRFAEHRTYFAQGEQVSEAVHYGYDLASTAGAPIAAANAGRVIFAEDLGIYGNCVIIDHGLGLSSLYAHLSQISVRVGDPVERDQELGRSGATGLAGGDHLHFAILVGGTYVDPKEWWDPRWVGDHIEARLRTQDR